MSRTRRLKSVLRYAAIQEMHAAKRVSEATAIAEGIKAQITQLQDYQTEYESKYTENQATGLSALNLQIFSEFLRQLSQGIGQQQHQLEMSLQVVAQEKAKWVEAYRYKEGIERVIKKNQRKMQILQDKYEQKEIDERSQQQWQRSHRN